MNITYKFQLFSKNECIIIRKINSNVFKIHNQNHLYNIIKQIKYKNRNYNVLSSILTWKTSSSFIKNFSFPLFNS